MDTPEMVSNENKPQMRLQLGGLDRVARIADPSRRPTGDWGYRGTPEGNTRDTQHVAGVVCVCLSLSAHCACVAYTSAGRTHECDFVKVRQRFERAHKLPARWWEDHVLVEGFATSPDQPGGYAVVEFTKPTVCDWPVMAELGHGKQDSLPRPGPQPPGPMYASIRATAVDLDRLKSAQSKGIRRLQPHRVCIASATAAGRTCNHLAKSHTHKHTHHYAYNARRPGGGACCGDQRIGAASVGEYHWPFFWCSPPHARHSHSPTLCCGACA